MNVDHFGTPFLVFAELEKIGGKVLTENFSLPETAEQDVIRQFCSELEYVSGVKDVE